MNLNTFLAVLNLVPVLMKLVPELEGDFSQVGKDPQITKKVKDILVGLGQAATQLAGIIPNL